MKVNINDTVKFKLTEKGIDICGCGRDLDNYKTWCRIGKTIFQSIQENEGYIVCPFWQMAQLIGGDNMYHGQESLIVDNTFELIGKSICPQT